MSLNRISWFPTCPGRHNIPGRYYCIDPLPYLIHYQAYSRTFESCEERCLEAWTSEGGKEKGKGSGPIGHELQRQLRLWDLMLPPIVTASGWAETLGESSGSLSCLSTD
jgi:hypothetical protein